MFTAPLGLMSPKVEVGDIFTITTDQSVLTTVRIKFVFTGTVTVDWGDGSASENFVSGVEKLHNYTITDQYAIKITGDTENITSFTADASRITAIGNQKTGLLTQLNLRNNKMVGTYDLSRSPVSVNIQLYSNVGLTDIIFASSGNGMVNNLRIYSCPALTGLDLTNVPVSGTLWHHANANFTSLVLAASGNGTVTDYLGLGCDMSSVDFSNTPVSGRFRVDGNTALNALSHKATGNGALNDYWFYNTSLPNLDLSIFDTSNGVNMQCQNNSFTPTEHDNQLINLNATGWINGTLTIITGNTARTSASDTAYNNLIANGWTIT